MTDDEDRQLFNDILNMEAQSPKELVVNGILQHMVRLIFKNGRFVPTRSLSGQDCGQWAL